MLYYVVKVILTAFIIVIISEISKRSSLLGGVLASIPLISFLSFIWIYIETKNTENIALLSKNIFWLVLPSLSLFILLPILLKKNLNFWLALFISTLVMIVLYYLMVMVLNKFGTKL
ncbi:MAG: DUF3147 family protein [Candidatus Marinimicrobia bacterium]|nr:DUF3147 family protein [Candidatus Neomarinimicrobiota bacterium]